MITENTTTKNRSDHLIVELLLPNEQNEQICCGGSYSIS